MFPLELPSKPFWPGCPGAELATLLTCWESAAVALVTLPAILAVLLFPDFICCSVPLEPFWIAYAEISLEMPLSIEEFGFPSPVVSLF
jgi:hypothetical protein